MWQLRMRGHEIRDWVDLGGFENIAPATRRVLEREGRQDGALFFRVYIDPPLGKSDAEILSRLEYQGDKGFYVLTRRVQ